MSVDGWQLNGTETPIQNLLNRIYCDADRLRSWFYSRIGSAGCVQDFIFYSDFIKRMRRQGGFKIFLHDPRNEKILLRSSMTCSKTENVLWKWHVRV